jgi:uncharacterized repeat protein (TIGR03803 family)
MHVIDVTGESNTLATDLLQSLPEQTILSPTYWPHSFFIAVSFFALLVSFGSPRAAAQSYQVLYSFSGPDGASTNAGLITDASGNLFGTTPQGGAKNAGTVFELVNSSGSYSYKLLYSFTAGNDGGYPFAGLILDAAGNLYGTTLGGGALDTGTVFELVNSSGTYSEKVLYSFGESGENDGLSAQSGLVMDASGNLYGTTTEGGIFLGPTCASSDGCGIVFELVNSSGTYTEKVLYSFTGSSGDGATPSGLVMDASGNLYGTTTQAGASGSGTAPLTRQRWVAAQRVVMAYLRHPSPRLV